jgi:hypothetical protein
MLHSTVRRDNPAAMLADLTDSAELFHTADGTAYVALMIDDHCENWPIRSSRFPTGSGINITRPRAPHRARGRLDRPSTYSRPALSSTHPDRIFTSAPLSMRLDLADEPWRAVEITPDGREVISRPPVRFRRAAGMLPLPMPVRGGSIEALWSFLNLSDRNDFVLLVAWPLAALRHGGPYPLLAVSGEQDSAKTFLSKLAAAAPSRRIYVFGTGVNDAL